MSDVAAPRPLSRQQWITLGLGACVVLLLYLPTLLWLVPYWHANLDNFIGVLAPVISVILVWMKRRNLSILGAWSDRRGLYWLIPGLLLHVFALAMEVPLLSGIALPMILHGLSLAIVGPQRTALLVFPIWFLIFAFPFMDMLEIYLSFPMRIISTVIADGMLMPFMEVTRSGASLFTPNLEVAVIPACSGMNYLSTLLMLGVLLAWLSESRLPAQLIAFVMTLPVVLLANGIRVATVAVMGNVWGRETALGFFHDFSGMLVFVLAVIGMIGVNAVVPKLLPDRVGDTTNARPRSEADMAAPPSTEKDAEPLRTAE